MSGWRREARIPFAGPDSLQAGRFVLGRPRGTRPQAKRAGSHLGDLGDGVGGRGAQVLAGRDELLVVPVPHPPVEVGELVAGDPVKVGGEGQGLVAVLQSRLCEALRVDADDSATNPVRCHRRASVVEDEASGKLPVDAGGAGDGLQRLVPQPLRRLVPHWPSQKIGGAIRREPVLDPDLDPAGDDALHSDTARSGRNDARMSALLNFGA